jgi:hypothetical protein
MIDDGGDEVSGPMYIPGFMPSYHLVAESEHELQNPTSPAKIRLLGQQMRLGSGSTILDVASGRSHSP